MRHIAQSLFCLYAFILLAGCQGQTSPNGKLQVVATTGMVADLVRNIGGDHVEVVQLMGEDVDPHLYKANAGDVAKLGRADLIFYNGLHLEGKLTEVLESMAKHKPVHAVTETIASEKTMAGEGSDFDPHVWFDVKIWDDARALVEQVLTEQAPDHANEFKKNSKAYHEKLMALDAEVLQKISTIPKKQRILITAHDAFRYFGKAYGMEVKGIQGISTESEASVKHINDLVQYISENNIKAVFVESSVNERYLKSLVEGCAARGHKVVIGGTLYSDAMGPPETPEGTYIGMVRHNVNTIVEALK